jgi:hypothetical protein
VSLHAAEAVVRAVLYEGYMLYPYRPTSLKNRQRWSFGGLYPPDRAEGPSSMQVQCLVEGDAPAVQVHVRFLHPAWRDGREEAAEREIVLPETSMASLLSPRSQAFRFEPDAPSGARQEVAEGLVTSHADRDRDVHRLTVQVRNTGASDRAILASTHVLIHVTEGALVSATDPPERLASRAAACRQIGCWPVLVGEEGSRDLMLASPIILYDYPRVAPESAGDLFDATEIDEILSLRILTLTPEEKAAARASDPRVGALLDRVEALGPAELGRLHGALRSPAPGGRARALKAGDRVRLVPKGRADMMDLALAGRSATVVSIETDVEDTVYVTVTVDDDPGRDLGLSGQPGHRFFFRLDEVEAP